MSGPVELPAFERDPYLAFLETEVVARGEQAGRPWVEFADTIFYPEGGGQPADRGFAGSVAVLDVRRAGAAIRHYLERPLEPGPVALRLDWGRRFDHMQHHTGQHLLSAVAEDRFGWPTTSFHLVEPLSDVELAVPALAAGELESLAEAVASEIRAARPVRVRRVAAAALSGLAVRTRGLPEGHAGEVRLVEIEGLDLNTCGGTHLASTAEVELLHLAQAEPMRGGTRLYFAAGRRARLRLGEFERREAELRRRLGVPGGELAAALDARLDAARAAARRERELVAALAAAEAARLAARAGPVGDAHYETMDLDFLRELARRWLAVEPGRPLFATAGGGKQACFVLAAGPAAGLDVRVLGRDVAAALGGRGGGDATLAQGRAGNLDGRPAALARLIAAVSPDAPEGA